MRWIDRLEQRFPWLGIPGLITYVSIGRALAYFLSLRTPQFVAYLLLDPVAVRHGEAWRLVSFLLTPPAGGVLFAVVDLYFTFMVGRILEEYWGAFRFTVYYLLGAVGTAAVALLFLNTPVAPYFLNLSLFLAFATLFPEMPILLFFILPVKVKYLGWLSAFLLTLAFWGTNLSGKLAIVAAFTNYLVFFWPEIRVWIRDKFRRKPGTLSEPRPEGRVEGLPTPPEAPAVHRCTTCGATEKDHPEYGFRWCSCKECGEGREYCMEHLKEHQEKIGKVDRKGRRNAR